MKKPCIGFVLLFLAANCALAQADFPPEMKGKWTNGTKSGESKIELVGMASPDKAKIKVTLTGSTLGPPHGALCMFGTVETVADRQANGWQIAANHMRCASYFMNIKLVEGKQRYEGSMSNDFTGGTGTVFYEW